MKGRNGVLHTFFFFFGMLPSLHQVKFDFNSCVNIHSWNTFEWTTEIFRLVLYKVHYSMDALQKFPNPTSSNMQHRKSQLKQGKKTSALGELFVGNRDGRKNREIFATKKNYHSNTNTHHTHFYSTLNFSSSLWDLLCSKQLMLSTDTWSSPLHACYRMLQSKWTSLGHLMRFMWASFKCCLYLQFFLIMITFYVFES